MDYDYISALYVIYVIYEMRKKMKRYIVQCKVSRTYSDVKEYKHKGYAIKYCKKHNAFFEHIKFRVVEVVYEEI